MSKIINSIFIAFILISCCAKTVLAADVAIVKIADYSAFDEVVSEFKKNVNCSTETYEITKDDISGDQLHSFLAGVKSKFIFCVGGKAAQEVADQVKNIPVIVSMVFLPGDYNFGPNVCGIYWNVSPAQEFSVAKEIVPNLKKIAVIYGSKGQSFIDKAKDIASRLGIELVSYKAANITDVATIVRDLPSDIKVFWMIPDPIISNVDIFDKIFPALTQKNILIIGSANVFVQKGAAFAVYPSYKKVGQQAAEIANQILAGTSQPSEIGIQFARDTSLYVNMKIKDFLSYSIPDSLAQRADKKKE